MPSGLDPYMLYYKTEGTPALTDNAGNPFTGNLLLTSPGGGPIIGVELHSALTDVPQTPNTTPPISEVDFVTNYTGSLTIDVPTVGAGSSIPWLQQDFGIGTDNLHRFRFLAQSGSGLMFDNIPTLVANQTGLIYADTTDPDFQNALFATAGYSASSVGTVPDPNTPFRFQGNPFVVPEPGTVALLAGMFAVGSIPFLRRYRRSRSLSGS